MEDLGRKIKKLDKLFKLRMDRNLEKLDITAMQMHTLIYLYHNCDKKITQKDLCIEFGVKHSTMSGILSRMQDKNLIYTKQDENNKKCKDIYVTEYALEIKEQLDLNRDNTERILVENLTANDVKNLHKYLDKLYNNLLNDANLTDQELKSIKMKKWKENGKC